jgi:2-oxoglutarate dehydrogenase E2 component (dihydrolipoamide succinyltransferase)
MSIEVRVPQLPESVADATLIAWRKKPGDSVQRDENLVDLETDKVVLEVPAPAAGVIKEVKVQDGATVISGQVLAVLEEGAAAAAAPAAKPAKAPERRASSPETRNAAPAGGGVMADDPREVTKQAEVRAAMTPADPVTPIDPRDVLGRYIARLHVELADLRARVAALEARTP